MELRNTWCIFKSNISSYFKDKKIHLSRGWLLLQEIKKFVSNISPAMGRLAHTDTHFLYKVLYKSFMNALLNPKVHMLQNDGSAQSYLSMRSGWQEVISGTFSILVALLAAAT